MKTENEMTKFTKQYVVAKLRTCNPQTRIKTEKNEREKAGRYSVFNNPAPEVTTCCKKLLSEFTAVLWPPAPAIPHIQTIIQTPERKLEIINMPKSAKKRASGGKHDHGPSVALVVNNGDAATK